MRSGQPRARDLGWKSRGGANSPSETSALGEAAAELRRRAHLPENRAAASRRPPTSGGDLARASALGAQGPGICEKPALSMNPSRGHPKGKMQREPSAVVSLFLFKLGLQLQAVRVRSFGRMLPSRGHIPPRPAPHSSLSERGVLARFQSGRRAGEGPQPSEASSESLVCCVRGHGK